MMAALGAVIPGLKTVKCSDAQEGDGKYKMHALTYRYSTQIYSLDGTTKSGQWKPFSFQVWTIKEMMVKHEGMG